MKKYFRFVIYIITSLIIIAICLDITYTTVYKYSKSNRSVMQIVINQKNCEFDYILLGSSRVALHLDEKLLNEKYSLNGMNLGFAAAGTNEIMLLLEAMIENNIKVGTLFVQLDFNWNYISPNEFAYTIFMPFIHEKFIAENLLQKPDNKKYYYIPFYRYIKYEPVIGFRNFIMNILNKKLIIETGYNPAKAKQFEGDKKFSYILNDKMNENIEKIINICTQNNIKYVFYTSPIYNLTSNNEIFEKYLQSYNDFSHICNDLSFFNNATHLNDIGAKFFTEAFGTYYFER